MTTGNPSSLVPTADELLAEQADGARAMFFSQRRGAVYGDTAAVYANAMHGELVVVPAEEVAP